MADRQVCNINFFLYTRFFCGYYYNFRICKPVQWLGRFYCVIVCASVIFFLFYTHSSDIYPKIMVIMMVSEYLFYVFTSLLMTNKYLLRYYQKTPFIDSNTNAYKIMRISLIGHVALIVLVKLAGLAKSWELYSPSIIHRYFASLEVIIRAFVDIGRLPLLFVLSLFYVRVRLMRQTLESNSFDCRNQGKHIQMYQAIMSGLEKTEGPVKLQLLVCFLFSSIFYLLAILYDLFYLKNFKPDDVSCSVWFWMVTEITVSCSPLLLSAVLSDLVSMEMQGMLTIVLERRLACKNEKDRAEIQKLFQLLKSNPFQYSLYHMVPLNVRTLLSFVSFSITTIIAILQIQSWTA